MRQIIPLNSERLRLYAEFDDIRHRLSLRELRVVCRAAAYWAFLRLSPTDERPRGPQGSPPPSEAHQPKVCAQAGPRRTA